MRQLVFNDQTCLEQQLMVGPRAVLHCETRKRTRRTAAELPTYWTAAVVVVADTSNAKHDAFGGVDGRMIFTYQVLVG